MRFTGSWSQNKYSVMRKLLRRSCLVIILPAVLLSAYFTWTNSRNLLRSNNELIQSAALRAAGSLEKIMQTVEVQTWQLLNNFDAELTSGISSLNTDYVKLAEMVRHFESAIYHSTYIEDIQYYSPTGNYVLTGTLGYLRTKNAYYFSDLKRALTFKKRSGWIAFTQALENGYLCYFQRLPLYVSEAQLRDVAISFVQIEAVLNEVDHSARRFEGQKFALLDSNGEVLCLETIDGLDEGGLKRMYQMAAENAAENSSFLFQEAQWDRFSCYYVRIGEYLLLSITPISAIEVAMDNWRREVALLFALIIFIAGGMALLFSFEVYRPLGLLVENTRKLNAPGLKNAADTDEYSYIHSLLNRYDEQVSLLTQSISEREPIIRAGLISLLLEGEQLPNIEQILRRHEMSAEDKAQVMAIGFRWQYGIIPSMDDLRRFTVDLLEKAALRCDIVRQDTDGMCVVAYASRQVSTAKLSARVCETAQNIRSSIAQKWQAGVAIGVGDACESVLDVSRSYRQAMEALAHKMVRGETVIVYNQDIEQTRAQCYYPINLEMELIQAARCGDQDECVRILNGIFQRNFSTENPLDLQSATCLMFNIVSTEIRMINDFPAFHKDALKQSEGLIKNALQCATFQEFYEKTLAVLGMICESSKTERDYKYERHVQAAIAYINQHYKEATFSQAETARALGISQPSLSTYFKRSTGENMVDYIGRLRVGFVKEILKDDSVSISEASERAGFGNVKTMIRQFKHYVGMTPGEYRKQIKLKERAE